MGVVGTTHPVRLGGYYLTLKPGSYSKRPAPTFGARFATGDPSYNNLSFWQHWGQKCFVGGMGAELFADDAMYDEGVGLTTTSHEQVVLGRDLRRGTGAGWALDSASNNNARKFFIYNNKLYCVTLPALGTASKLYKYTGSTDAWTDVGISATTTVRSVTAFAGRMYFGTEWTGVRNVWYASGTLATWTQVPSIPVSATGTAWAMRAFQKKLYVAFGTNVWRLKSNNTWDGSTVFYDADMNSESNRIVSMETHLGFLYMLSLNGHIHRTDGMSTFDIWSWEGETLGVALRSFDGRLFVSTYEYSDADGSWTDAGFSVLYQMTGSAVTELKRWGDETVNTIISNLYVHDRKLFYAASNLLNVGDASGFGVAVYDPVEDAHSIFASNRDSGSFPSGGGKRNKLRVDDVIYFAGKVWVTVAGYGVFNVRYTHRDYKRLTTDWDTSTAGAQLGPRNGGWMTTSTYDAGTPGLDKLWRKVVVDYALPHSSTGIVVEYSLDEGETWTTAHTLSTGSSVKRRQTSVWLDNVRSTSLKLRITLRSTNSTYTPFLYGFVVSYLPMPEPNWLWTFTAVVSQTNVLMNGNTETVSTEALFANLASAYRNRVLVNFVDLNDQQWAVLLHDFAMHVFDYTRPYEGEVTVTLIEASENII